MLVLILSADFLLHVPYWLHCYRGSFFYTFRSGFIFILGVSLTHPALASVFFYFYKCGQVLLHIPCWLLFMLGVSLTHPVLSWFLCREFLLHIPCWLFLMWGALSSAVWVWFWVWRQSLKKGAGWKLTQEKKCVKVTLKPENNLNRAEQNRTRTEGVSLTHPVLAFFLSFFLLF